MENTKNKRLINISTKTFIGVAILLFLLMVAAIVMTFVIPHSEFIYEGEKVVGVASLDEKGGEIKSAMHFSSCHRWSIPGNER